jgi:hypothetical protein
MRDVVTEMQRRSAYYKSTGRIQAPLLREYSQTSSKGGIGYASYLGSELCDRCGANCEGVYSHRVKFDQIVCENCSYELKRLGEEVN